MKITGVIAQLPVSGIPTIQGNSGYSIGMLTPRRVCGENYPSLNNTVAIPTIFLLSKLPMDIETYFNIFSRIKMLLTET